MVKCECRIADIHKIDILTKLRTINVNDYEVFDLIGYDRAGNSFTTLEGLSFDWKINQKDNLAAFETFKGAGITTSSERMRLERSGYQTDTVVMKGIKPGVVSVEVSPREKSQRVVIRLTQQLRASVDITIIEPFLVYPDNDFFLLPHTSIQMKLFSVSTRTGFENYAETRLPNSTFEWIVDHSDIAVVDSSGRLTAKSRIGSTSVIVRDKRAVNNSIKVGVHVVEPFSIKLFVSEVEESSSFWEEFLPFIYRKTKTSQELQNNWNMIKGKKYYIRAEVYEELNHRILLSDEAKLSWSIPDCMKVAESRDSEIIVTASKLTLADQIETSIESVTINGKVHRLSRRVSSEKKVSVSTNVVIIAPRETILLPHSKKDHIRGTITLRPLGGSGTFEWSSSNTSVAIIDEKGRVQTIGTGKTTITLMDQVNPSNRHSVEVEVDEPTDLEFIERHKEIEVGRSYNTAVFAVNSMGRRFTSCLSMGVKQPRSDHAQFKSVVKPQVDHPDFARELKSTAEKNGLFSKRLLASPVSFVSFTDYRDYTDAGLLDRDAFEEIVEYYTTYGICGQVTLLGVAEGESEHSVSMSVGGKSAVQRVRVLRPLSQVLPAKNKGTTSGDGGVLVAYLSGFDWTVAGGPFAWGAWRPLVSQSVHRIDEKSMSVVLVEVEVGEEANDGLIKARVKCGNDEGKRTGSYRVEVVKRNPADEYLIFPLEMKVDIVVTCAMPDVIEWFELTSEKQPFSYNNIRTDYFKPPSLKSGKNHTLQVWAFDSKMKAFYSFDSLVFSWGTSDKSQVTMEVHSQSDQLADLSVKAETGRVKIHTHSSTFKDQKFDGKKFSPPLQKEASFEILNEMFLSPTRQLLILSRDTQSTIKVMKGSGKFAVHLNDSKVVEMRDHLNNNSITIFPRRVGDVLVEVTDTLSPSPEPVSCLVRVRSPEKVRLVLDSNLAVENKQVYAWIKVYDSEGEEFDLSYAPNLKLTLSLDTSQSTSSGDISIVRLGGNRFSVEGKRVGEFSLVGMLEIEGYQSYISNYEILEVYPPLKVIPGRILNSPGCSSTVKVVGGPSATTCARHNLTIVHTVDNKGVVQVTKAGRNLFEVKSEKLGEAKMRFSLVDGRLNPITFTVLPVSVDYVDQFRVLNMDDRRVYLDAPVRLIAQGIIKGDLMTPSHCGFQYKWQVSSPEVLSLGPQVVAFHSTDGGALLAVNATGIREGHCTITLSVQTSQEGRSVMETSVGIQVIPRVTVSSPTYVFHEFERNNHVILPPHTSYTVNTSLPDHLMNYRLVHSSTPGKVQVSARGEIRVQEAPGEGVVAISDRNSDDQVSYVNVRVVEVYSILVENSYKAEMVPVGSEVTFTVDLQNENGFLYPQPLEGAGLVAVSTHGGVVEVRFDQYFSKITVVGVSKGQTYVIVYLESNPSVYDIFRVDVGCSISPAEPVTIHRGGTVQYVVAGAKLTSEKARWDSDNSDVVSVDQHTGRAVAHKAGSASVFIRDVSLFRSKVTVVEADRLYVSSSSDTGLTNNPQSSRYKKKYRLMFEAEQKGQRIASFTTKEELGKSDIDFSCKSTQEELFETRGKIEVDERGDQKLVCEIYPNESGFSSREFPSTIIVVATLSTKDGFSLVHSSNIDFEWGFNVGGLQPVKCYYLRSC